MIKQLKNKIKVLIKNVKKHVRLLQFMSSEGKRIKNAEVIFFFPFYSIGGAEKIHLQIIEALSKHKTYTFFTGVSENEALLNSFEQSTHISNIVRFINAPEFIKERFDRFVTTSINNNTSIKSVFGCNSFYFYDLLPMLNSEIRKIDLIHAFSSPDYGIEIYSEKYIPLLTNRVVINNKTLEDLKNQYSQLGVSNEYEDNIVVIENGLLHINNSLTVTKPKLSFNIGFIGRWSNEKRPHIFVEVAKKVKTQHLNINFVMAGPEVELYKDKLSEYGIENKGEIHDAKDLSDLYNSLAILVVSSYREGFPLVIMEAMQYSVAIIATDVGSIREHVVDYNTGFLIPNHKDENQIIDEMVKRIIELHDNSDVLSRISQNVQQHAKDHFGIDTFNKAYKAILLNRNVSIS